ncbi:phage terminase small subunit P27 family [Xanthovirga aplysinae]|uniref:phage terminase small subunit P27 family n=1 Tax=Xanthovirga aplysinae TaxID=2529853 RepID=UPI0012BD17C2|nr:phage terminase small subunit P27 family [Xanthovirga aplysinae]MTI32807.1 phage terminase small subunit P27 family [Xanthovirga aplysinae]
MPGKPKPTQMKVISGTLQKCRTNKKEPKLPTDYNPSPPEWLDKKGKLAFRQLAKELGNMQVLTTADRKALELLCDAYSEYREARKAVKELGSTYESINQSGGVMYRARPEVAIASDAWKRVRSMMSEFGLTPSSRSKVAATGEKEKDPLEAFLNQGRA